MGEDLCFGKYVENGLLVRLEGKDSGSEEICQESIDLFRNNEFLGKVIVVRIDGRDILEIELK